MGVQVPAQPRPEFHVFLLSGHIPNQNLPNETVLAQGFQMDVGPHPPFIHSFIRPFIQELLGTHCDQVNEPGLQDKVVKKNPWGFTSSVCLI